MKKITSLYALLFFTFTLILNSYALSEVPTNDPCSVLDEMFEDVSILTIKFVFSSIQKSETIGVRFYGSEKKFGYDNSSEDCFRIECKKTKTIYGYDFENLTIQTNFIDYSEEEEEYEEFFTYDCKDTKRKKDCLDSLVLSINNTKEHINFMERALAKPTTELDRFIFKITVRRFTDNPSQKNLELLNCLVEKLEEFKTRVENQ